MNGRRFILDTNAIIFLLKGNKNLLSNIIKIRKSYKIKLPDAIIISTAITNNSILITADKQLQRVKEVEVISF